MKKHWIVEASAMQGRVEQLDDDGSRRLTVELTFDVMPAASDLEVPTVNGDESWQRFEIHSLLADGTAPARVMVPNVLGQPPGRAHQLLRDAGLRPAAAVPSSSDPNVVVHTQEPKHGTLVEPDSEVELTYALINVGVPVGPGPKMIDFPGQVRWYCDPLELPCDDQSDMPYPFRFEFDVLS